MRVVVIMALVFLSFSCATQRRCFEKYDIKPDTVLVIETRDSIVFRDTTLYIVLPSEIVYDTVEIPCPSQPEYVPDTARAETSLAVAKAWWDHPNIQLELTQRDSIISFRIDSLTAEIYRWKNRYEMVTSVVTVNKIPVVYKISLWMVIGMILLITFIALRK